MTLSANARIANLNEAMIAFLDALGEGAFSYFHIVRTAYPGVLGTTWTELTDHGWLRDENMNVVWYQFTPFGYVQALKVSGRSKEQQFLKGLGNICKVLKDALQNRSDFALVVFQDLVRDSGVSEAFARNAIDADLIWHVLGRIGAQWEGEHLLKVPPNFGLLPI
jgi:hypothetical protein